MQRQAWVLKIRAGKEQEYRAAHADVWPGLIQASIEAGFRNHTVFVQGRMIIAYLEAEDVRAADARLADKEVLIRWNQAMSELLEETETPPFQEVFHFD
jgi:L-rhamnose mutarotase